MATEWFLKSFDDEFGPISFTVLVDLARNGTLLEDDLVRPAAGSQFQRADSIIGLFYMARRAPDKKSSMPLVGQSMSAETPKPAATTANTSAPAAADSRPDWLVRLLEARANQSAGFRTSAASDAGVPCPSPGNPEFASGDAPGDTVDKLVASSEGAEVANTLGLAPRQNGPDVDSMVHSSGSDWSRAVGDALDATERRLSKSDEVFRRRGGKALNGCVVRFCSHLVEQLGGGQRLAGLAYRLLAGILSANLVAYWIVSWSSQEALRFPSRAETSVHIFPLIGACGDQEYLFWLFDAAIGAGCLAFWAATVLVAKAEG